MPISAIGTTGLGAVGTGQTPGSSQTPSADGLTSFGDSLGRMISDVKSSAGTANDAVAGMLNGSGDLGDAMIALQRADLTLQLTVQVRNKLVSAYQQIMQMPV
ncbi:MAG: flagellar hook-basal body complex protein FliE [Acidobacteriota bacterium]|nr:flagellar hook-basal body complex protein FliE [Acidobacteriota bacterium]